MEIQDEQILPWKNTIAEAAPHAVLPVRMDSLKPQSELLFCTERCVITYATEFVGNTEESWKYFKQWFSQFMAVTDTKLMNNTGKVTSLTHRYSSKTFLAERGVFSLSLYEDLR